MIKKYYDSGDRRADFCAIGVAISGVDVGSDDEHFALQVLPHREILGFRWSHGFPICVVVVSVGYIMVSGSRKAHHSFVESYRP